jgi:hypothetical protein
MVLEDSIKLARKKKEDIVGKEKFRSLTRVMPIKDESSAAAYVYQTLTKVRQIYYMLAPIKSKFTITSSNFEKLMGKTRSLPWLNFDTTAL